MKTLRELYGDEVTDKVLALPMYHQSIKGTTFLVPQKHVMAQCCIVGALNITLGTQGPRTIGERMAVMPVLEVAKEDTRRALQRPLTEEEAATLSEAIQWYDAVIRKPSEPITEARARELITAYVNGATA